jgi:hypothetical protein
MAPGPWMLDWRERLACSRCGSRQADMVARVKCARSPLLPAPSRPLQWPVSGGKGTNHGRAGRRASRPAGAGVVMGELAFARPARPLYKFAAYFGGRHLRFRSPLARTGCCDPLQLLPGCDHGDFLNDAIARSQQGRAMIR